MNVNFLPVVVVLLAYCMICAQKGIMYDPEKGIIFEGAPAADIPAAGKKSNSYSSATVPKKVVEKKNNISEDLHVGRQKDPPEVYFNSGLEYFKNNDFDNALKNFAHADSASDNPLFKLWKAKSLRRLGNTDEMLKLLNVVAENYDTSNIADDALLELAVYYKSINDYENALQSLTQIIEQYPFAVSSSSGEELPPIAREQRKLIRAELLNILSIIGIKKDDLTAGLKQFQKDKNLPITGTATLETVTTLKTIRQQSLSKEQKMFEEKVQVLDYIALTVVTVVCILIIFSIFLYLRIQISHKKKLCIELKKALLELDLKKL